jgi:hypothetical protein
LQDAPLLSLSLELATRRFVLLGAASGAGLQSIERRLALVGPRAPGRRGAAVYCRRAAPPDAGPLVGRVRERGV